jgi:UDP:flavonoid glycosyltransferase YjiC (YdhE family)
VLTGFSLYDDPLASDAPGDRARVLDGGPAPVVFTPGSGRVHEKRFFEVAIEASRRLGRPALLLTRFRQQLPPALPPHARHVPYFPLGELLPRAAAIVHHGGIGTCAQALRAGTPQLIMPSLFDQLDNAARVRRLGAGASLSRRRFRPGIVERALRDMIDSAGVQESCRDASRRMSASRAEAIACDAIERAGSRPTGS